MTDEVHKKIESQKSEKKKNDRVHFFISLALIAMSYIFYSDYADFRKKAPKLGIEMRPMSDLGYIVGMAILMHLVRRVIDYFLRAPLEAKLREDNLLDLDLRRDKLTRQIYDTIYYFGIYFLGRFIATDIDYIPDCIGGAGTCDSLGKYWPRMVFHDKMRMYIILQFGHHLHNLVYHTVAMKNVGNYFEMITHHYAAVVSLFYSYFTNWEDYAFIILICHDLSDGILNLGKVSRDMKFSTLTNICWVFLAFFWFYHRTYIIASCYFYKTYEYYWWKAPFPEHMDLWHSVKRGVNFIIFNIFIIWILNIVWWVQIVKMGVNKFIKKKAWVSHHEGEIDSEEIKNKAKGGYKDKPATSDYPVSKSPLKQKDN